MPDRLMAGQRPLKPSIVVRIHVGHHNYKLLNDIDGFK